MSLTTDSPRLASHVRHRPEQTLLYQLVERHYPEFTRRMVNIAALLVDDVLPKVPLRQWARSVPFQIRFLFDSYPELMGKALGIVYHTIGHLADRNQWNCKIYYGIS